MTEAATGAPRVALQLYTLRRQAEQDLEAALDRAAAAGYREIEWFGGLWGRTADDLRGLLSERGLGLMAAHVPLAELEADPAAVMETWRALHCQVLVCPWLDEAQRGDGSRAHYLELGRRLDLLSYRFRAGGFRFAYHNHEFELLPFDDVQPPSGPSSTGERRRRAGCTAARMQRDFRHGPPGRDGLRALVSRRTHDGWGLELDTYWAAFAGVDPAALIRELGDRIHLLHLKDGLLPGPPDEPAAERPATDAATAGQVRALPGPPGRRAAERATSERWFRPLGEGDVDVAGCVDAALETGVRLFVVEQDETAEAGGAPERDAAASLGHLRTRTALGAAAAKAAAP